MLGDKNVISQKSSRYITRSIFLQHRQVWASCVMVCSDLGFFCVMPSHVELCLLTWQCIESCPFHSPCPTPRSGSLLLCAMCQPAALNWYPIWACQKPLCAYSVISRVISGKFPIHKGLFTSLHYAQGRTHQTEAANLSVSQTTSPGWRNRMKGRLPLLPGEHSVPIQQSLTVGVGSWAPWQRLMLFRHSW